MGFARLTPEEAQTHRPRVVVLDEKNSVVRYEGPDERIRTLKSTAAAAANR